MHPVTPTHKWDAVSEEYEEFVEVLTKRFS